MASRSIASPAVSTGICAFPADRAARIAIETITAAATEDFDRIIFRSFSEASAAHHERAITSAPSSGIQSL
jgi:O-acetyl-ADP-ribose deacetylase (regulator of RNase III)